MSRKEPCMAQQYSKEDIRKVTILQFALLAVLLAVAFVLYYFLAVRPNGTWVGLYPIVKNNLAWLWMLPGFTVPLLILYVFLKLIPSMDYIYDENVRALADMYSLKFMVGYFLINAFMEEVLFRGALQCSIGLLPAAIIFTLVHVSYYKKPLMLVEVFVLGLFIGFLFEMTQSLWITTICHGAYNWILMWLIKTERVQYRQSNL